MYLELKNLHKRFDKEPVVNDLNLSLEKGQLPQKSDTARLQHYMNLFLLSGEIHRSMTDAEALQKLAPELCVSYEAFLSEVMRLLNIAPQKEPQKEI